MLKTATELVLLRDVLRDQAHAQTREWPQYHEYYATWQLARVRYRITFKGGTVLRKDDLVLASMEHRSLPKAFGGAMLTHTVHDGVTGHDCAVAVGALTFLTTG